VDQKWGHKELVDQTECVLRVMPQSNNPDLVPSDPYIGLVHADGVEDG